MLSLYQPRRMIIILNTIRLPAVDWSPGILLAHHFIEPTPTSPMNNDDCILPNDTSPNSVSEVMATWGLRRLWTGVAWKGSAGRGYLEIAGVQMTLGKTSATMTMKLITASFALINGTIPFSFFIDIHNLVLHNIRSTTPEIYNPLYQVLLLHLLTTKIKPSYLHLYFIKSHKPITSNQQNPKEKKKEKENGLNNNLSHKTKPNNQRLSRPPSPLRRRILPFKWHHNQPISTPLPSSPKHRPHAPRNPQGPRNNHRPHPGITQPDPRNHPIRH